MLWAYLFCTVFFDCHPSDTAPLPVCETGLSIVNYVLHWQALSDVYFEDGHGKLSGAVYMAGEEHRQLLNKVYEMFSQTNPLHTSIFPSVGLMERDVVFMTASLLGGLSRILYISEQLVNRLAISTCLVKQCWPDCTLICFVWNLQRCTGRQVLMPFLCHFCQ